MSAVVPSLCFILMSFNEDFYSLSLVDNPSNGLRSFTREEPAGVDLISAHSYVKEQQLGLLPRSTLGRHLAILGTVFLTEQQEPFSNQIYWRSNTAASVLSLGGSVRLALVPYHTLQDPALVPGQTSLTLTNPHPVILVRIFSNYILLVEIIKTS